MAETFGGAFTQRSRDERVREFPLRRPIVVPVTNVTNGNTTLHTVADDYSMKIKNFGVCNITAGALAVTVYVVPTGGSAANTNKVYDAHSVGANTSEQLTALVGATLEPGDFIVVVTDDATTGGNFFMDGVEFQGGLPDA